MELKQINYFLMIAEQGSYAKAAEELALTQSALTQSIARLEREVGTKLLHRGRYGASLTEAGSLLFTRAKLIAAEERLAHLELQGYQDGSKGQVTIGAGKSVTQTLLPAALMRFSQRCPDVTVTVLEGWSPELYQKLLAGDLDFVISAAFPQVRVDPDLIQEHLFNEFEFLVVGPKHPLFTKPAITLQDLAIYHWVMPPHGSGRVRQVQAQYLNLGMDPPTRFIRTDSLPMLMGLLKHGPVVCFGTPELMAERLEQTNFRFIDIPGFTEERRAAVTMRRRSRLHPAAASLVEDIRILSRQRPKPEEKLPVAGVKV